jgi:hypothetical protein
VTSPLELSRAQILGFRRRVGALDLRLPMGPDSLRKAAWAGLQDSMPRAAVLSIHARVEGATPSSWEDSSLVQLWGPRFSVYVVAERDRGVFSLSRLPDDAKGRKRAEDAAAHVHAALQAEQNGTVGPQLGDHPYSLRRAVPTGTVLIRWAGARAPTLRTVPRPDMDPLEARRELARRYLHVYGPTTAGSFSEWAGIHARSSASTFETLHEELTPTRTPIGDASILSSDEPGFLADPTADAPARLLPSGDAYYLLQGADRTLLVPDAGRRAELWTSRVWPGAVLLDGDIRGTWRRSQGTVIIQAWGRTSRRERDAVEAEAASLPLPDVRRIVVRWGD